MFLLNRDRLNLTINKNDLCIVFTVERQLPNGKSLGKIVALLACVPRLKRPNTRLAFHSAVADQM
jgi:hypothetical protein